ncbi:MAG: hypothetical protein GY773_05010 [Actinomycetia bacterium]|nr:hypothetical protein [Actinomycetes bacterium]
MWCFWNAKGGSGCSTVAAAFAALVAKDGPTLLVDLGGDLPAVFGIASPELGVFDWLDAESPPPDGLSRLEVPITERLSLLPSGTAGWGVAPDTAQPATEVDTGRLLAIVLDRDPRQVIVDVGLDRRLGASIIEHGSPSYLVTRACYLSTVQARFAPKPDGIVVVREPGRLLSDHDIAAAWSAPVVASLRWDAAVAVANDVGSLTRRLPRSLRRLSALLRDNALHR